MGSHNLLRELKATGRLSSADNRKRALDRLILGQQGKFPIVGKDSALFLYRGSVRSSICVAGDFNNWDARSDPMTRLTGTDIYYLRIELPPDARVEYKFVKDGEWILDPLNSESASGKFGSNSVLVMRGYCRPSEEGEAPSVRWEEQQFDCKSKALGITWTIRLRLPSDLEPHSMLLVLDGSDYVEFGKIYTIVDKVAHSEGIEPFALVLADAGDREPDYAMVRSCCRTIVEEIVPTARAKIGLPQNPSKTAVLGASKAGLVSSLSALIYPQQIGKAAAQSGYFSGQGYDIIMSSIAALRGHPSFYLDCGRFEANVWGQGSIIHASREVAAALRSRGCRTKLVETNEGHNWTAWRGRLPGALKFLFGGQSDVPVGHSTGQGTF